MLVDTRVPEEAPLSDDRDLVAQSLAGDAASFTTLLRRYDDKMRGVAWRLVASRAEMDDVLQDAYLKAWRHLATFRGEAAFSSWLYRIVHTTALDHNKAAARRRIVPLDDASDVVVADSAGTLVDSLELRAALAQLPADQFAVVALVDGQGETYEDVAELLDISPGTVGSRLSRARAALRRSLSPPLARGDQGGLS